MTPQEYGIATELIRLSDVYGFEVRPCGDTLELRPLENLRKRFGYSASAKFNANSVEEAIGFIRGFDAGDFAHNYGKPKT